MGAVTYPDERVYTSINEQFVPVQINIVDHPEYRDRFNSQWTPTIFFLDQNGREQRRVVGYSPPEDFIVELEMGLAQVMFNSKRYEDSVKRYESVVARFPESDLAPEALYMVGVSRYRATDDGSNLVKYWDEVMERYPKSRWAKAGDV